MITREALLILAKKYQTEEVNIWREYFQHLFLFYFYRQEHTDKIYFKGGTALRLVYQSPRFSEDLDFGSSLKDVKKIEQAVIAALAEIEREGVGTELEHATATTGGYLAIIRFKNNGGSIAIELDISLRNGKKKKGEITTIVNDFIPPYTITQLSLTQMVEEKIVALLSRKKPRDFYDFYFILRANLFPEKQKDILQKILKAFKTTSTSLDKELKRFLPKSHWPVIRDFSATFERELKRFL